MYQDCSYWIDFLDELKDYITHAFASKIYLRSYYTQITV